MKLVHVIFLAVAFCASYPINSFAEIQSETKIAASKEKNPQDIEISSYDNHIKVTNAPVGSILEIYSVVGIKVKEIEIKQPTAEYTVNIAKGYYIIRIDDTVRKIAIR